MATDVAGADEAAGATASKPGLEIQPTRVAEALSIEGTTRWMRSEQSPGHVFCYTVDLDPFEWIGPHKDVQAWVNKALHAMPENARIRFTVEVVDA